MLSTISKLENQQVIVTCILNVLPKRNILLIVKFQYTAEYRKQINL